MPVTARDTVQDQDGGHSVGPGLIHIKLNIFELSLYRNVVDFHISVSEPGTLLICAYVVLAFLYNHLSSACHGSSVSSTLTIYTCADV
jgi:hypothetical protein